MKLPRLLTGGGAMGRTLHHTPLGARAQTSSSRLHMRKPRINPETALREMRWRINNTAERFIDIAHMYQVDVSIVQRLADEDPAYFHILAKEPLK